jgi:SAM-dependent methyltransferase
MTGLRPDFGATAQDYARHRAGFPESFFERLTAMGIGIRGQVVLDLGTGTGSLARGFARRGCVVTGIDLAAKMLDEAKRLAAAEGVAVEFRIGRAEGTGLPAHSADVVSAGQCWHWFDRPRAIEEVTRVLTPAGALVIGHFDWIPIAGTVAEATQRLIEQHNKVQEFGGGVGLYPQWLRDVADARFRDIETFSYDVAVPYTPERWRGRVRASAAVAATLSPDKVREFDEALAVLLESGFPDDILEVPHRVWAVVAHAPA